MDFRVPICYKTGMRSAILFFFPAYIAVVLGAGLLARRRMKGLEDFFLASRSLPGALIALSLTASWFGASSILVTTDEALRSGTSALWLVGLPAVAAVLLIRSLVRPLRRLSILTLPDLAEERYGRAVRRLTAALILWSMVLLAASQMVALGDFLRTFLKLSFIESLALGTGVVLVYSLAGGLRSVVATDIIQCALLAAALVWLVIHLAASQPPASPAAADPNRFALLGDAGIFRGFGRNGLIFLSFVLGWTISPIALQRVQAARSDSAARRGLSATAAILFILYGLVVLVGLLSRPFFEGLPGQTLIPVLIRDRLGLWLGGFLFMAVLAAVMSTLDTALNAGALTLTRDVFDRIRPGRGGRAVARSRLATVAVAVLAFGVATRFQSILKTLGLASEILAEGFFVPGLAMILSTKRRPWAGLLSLGLGGGFAVLSFLASSRLVPLRIPVWPASVPWGIGLGILGFALGVLIERRKS